MGDRTKRGLSASYLVAAAIFGPVAAPSLAQITTPPSTPQGTPPPNVPATIPPGQIAPSRDQLQIQPPTPTAPAGKVSVDASRAIRTAPCPLSESSLKVTLKGVRFTGPGGAPLNPLLAAPLRDIETPTGQTSIATVCDIRDKANLALQRSRYVASVQIPPQDLSGGILTLTVISAHITEIRVHGDPGRYRDLLLHRIEQIKKLNPLNARDAERILLLAGDVPGLDVQLSLRPAGTAPGDVIGDLTVLTRRFALLGNAQNYGSRQLGRYTGYLRGEAYGLLTNSDIFYVGASSTSDTKEQKVGQVGYITGIGGNGFTAGARFTYALSRPDLDQLDLRSKSMIGGVDLIWPVMRSIDRNVSLGGGAELIEQRTRVYSNSVGTPLNLDKLRVGYLRATSNARFRRPSGRELFNFSAMVEVRKGTGLFGATQRGVVTTVGYSPSRFEGDPKAWVVRGDADAVLSLGRIISFAGSLRSQWANHPLLNFEEFSIGNLSIGRGYDPGANSGDRAVGFRGEGRANLPIFTKLPIQAFGFYDNVHLWNLDQNSTEANRVLRSYGGGVRVSLPGRALLDVMYAKPIDKALSFDDKPPPARVLVSLTIQFTPPAR
jgi:hemolysin activation/secretion protein